MFVRLVFTLTVISMLISGCTPTREITYNINSIQPVPSLESVSVITRGLTLSIEPFGDIRQTIPENGILFVRERETTLNEKDYCINSEEHYKKNSVPYQVAKIMARHFNNSRYAKVRFQALSSVACGRPKSPADVRQESDGVCSDFGADNPLFFSEIISNCVGKPSRVLRFRKDLFASFSLGEKEDASSLWSTDINHPLRNIS